MRCIAIEAFGGPDRLQLADLPRPGPEKGEILIRTVAAGVNPVDWKIREGLLKEMLPHAFPLIPGWDVAGVVEEIGEDAGRFKKGDRVWAYARKPTVQWGTYAEYVSLPETSVGAMPSKLLFEEAASVPLAALTAYQALFEEAGLEKGSTVLVQAAAGGVGQFAVQLARDAGARVIGTAGSGNHEFVLGLGAETVIDYAREDFVKAARRTCPDGVDVILDGIGGETQVRGFDALRPGGILVSIVGPPDEETARGKGVRTGSVFVRPDADQLGILERMVDAGRLRTHVARIHPLAEAAEAQKASQAGHVKGKLVLAM